jgi:hypothetical protein
MFWESSWSTLELAHCATWMQQNMFLALERTNTIWPVEIAEPSSYHAFMKQSTSLLEVITLRCQKQTHKRLKILTIFSWSRGCKHVLTLAKQHASTKCWQWLLLISLTHSYLPLTWDLSRSKVHNLPDWLKGLGDGLGHAVWWAMELYRNLEEVRTL